MPTPIAFVRIAALALPLFVAASPSAQAAPDDAGAGTVEAKPKKNGKKKSKKKNKKGKKGKKKSKGAKHMRGLCGQLSCTAPQAEQISARLQTLREQQRDARKGQAALQTALSRELAKEKPSKKELARIQKDVARMQGKTADAALDALLDIHAVLDAEQRKTLASIVERQGLRRLMRGGGPAGRRPGSPPGLRQRPDAPPPAPPPATPPR